MVLIPFFAGSTAVGFIPRVSPGICDRQHLFYTPTYHAFEKDLLLFKTDVPILFFT